MGQNRTFAETPLERRRLPGAKRPDSAPGPTGVLPYHLFVSRQPRILPLETSSTSKAPAVIEGHN